MSIVCAGSCSNSVAIGADIANYLNLPFFEINADIFADSEVYAQVRMDHDNNVTTEKGVFKLEGSHVIYVQSTAPDQSKHLMELFLTLHVFQKYNVDVTLVTPYLAHSRQDREFKPGEAVSIDTIGQIFACLGVKTLFTVDVHFNRTIGEFNRFSKFDKRINIALPDIIGFNISAAPELCRFIKENLGIDSAVVVIPDEGHRPIYNSIKNVWGNNVIYLSKKRVNDFKVKIKGNKYNLVDKEIVIIDDMISTGTTIIDTVGWLKKLGAEKFTVACTHGLYIPNAKEKLKKAGINNFVSTDTIENPSRSTDHTVKIAPIISKALKEYLYSQNIGDFDVLRNIH